MYTLLITIALIVVTIIIYRKSLININIKRKKNKLENYLDLHDLRTQIKDYEKRETKVIFYCEKLVSNYYSKLLIFNLEHDLDTEKPIEILINKKNPIKSDFTEKIILRSINGEEKEFIINICYYMNNYYQLLLDKIEDPISSEIIFYSRKQKFPDTFKGENITFKDYDNNNIPFLKRYNIININRKELYQIYDNYVFNKLKDENKFLLEKFNSLFINFIDKIDQNNYEGKIFEQEEDEIIEDFNEKEIELLENTLKFLNGTNISDIPANLIWSLFLSSIKIDNTIVKGITKKISSKNYFIKYLNDIPDKKMIEIIESALFIESISKQTYGIGLYQNYLEYKKKILKNEDEFNNFEKLVILVNIYDLLSKYPDFKLVRLYDLSFSSPFVESEKIYLDIIKKINENSCLYFFYLQINSSYGFDNISLNTWYKIKYIPLIEIKAHLLYCRYNFFFLYNSPMDVPAFVNPQTLIKSFNSCKKCGYIYKKNLENEKNINNTAKLLIYKFHENCHSKLDCENHKSSSPRYLYNFDLEVLDSHYDTIIAYKLGKELPDTEKKGEDVGEEGYSIELFLYNDYSITDTIMESNDNLEKLCTTELYSGNNFKELKKILSDIIKAKVTKFNKNKNEVKKLNFYSKKNQENNKQKRNRIYYFRNGNIEDKY